MKKEYIPFVNDLIELAIREDIGDGDHTSLCCIPHDERGRMKLLIKQEGILAGVEIAEIVLRRLDPMSNSTNGSKTVHMSVRATLPFMSRGA